MKYRGISLSSIEPHNNYYFVLMILLSPSITTKFTNNSTSGQLIKKHKNDNKNPNN